MALQRPRGVEFALSYQRAFAHNYKGRSRGNQVRNTEEENCKWLCKGREGWSLHCHIKEHLPIIIRVVQGATKFEILKKKIANGFAKAERGGVCIVISKSICP